MSHVSHRFWIILLIILVLELCYRVRFARTGNFCSNIQCTVVMVTILRGQSALTSSRNRCELKSKYQINIRINWWQMLQFTLAFYEMWPKSAMMNSRKFQIYIHFILISCELFIELNIYWNQISYERCPGTSCAGSKRWRMGK